MNGGNKILKGGGLKENETFSELLEIRKAIADTNILKKEGEDFKASEDIKSINTSYFEKVEQYFREREKMATKIQAVSRGTIGRRAAKQAAADAKEAQEKAEAKRLADEEAKAAADAKAAREQERLAREQERLAQEAAEAAEQAEREQVALKARRLADEAAKAAKAAADEAEKLRLEQIATNQKQEADKAQAEAREAEEAKMRQYRQCIEGKCLVKKDSQLEANATQCKYYMIWLFEHSRKFFNGDVIYLIGFMKFGDELADKLSPKFKQKYTELKQNIFITYDPSDTNSLFDGKGVMFENMDAEKRDFDKTVNIHTAYYRKIFPASPAGDKHMLISTFLWFINGGKTDGNFNNISYVDSLNDNDRKLLINILKKCTEQINNLISIWNAITVENGVSGGIRKIKKAYIKKIQEKKNVINFLNVRDDSAPREFKMRNNRWNIDWQKDSQKSSIPDTTQEIGFDSLSNPLKIKYNDTELEINKGLDYSPSLNFDDVESFTDTYKIFGYDYQFHAGQFNNDIIERLYRGEGSGIRKRYEHDKHNIVFLGYGQSGSGKTSSLVQLKLPDSAPKDGILIMLVKNKIQPTSIRLSAVEIYNDTAAQKRDKACAEIQRESGRWFVNSEGCERGKMGYNTPKRIPIYNDTLTAAAKADKEISGIGDDKIFFRHIKKNEITGNSGDDPGDEEESRGGEIMVLEKEKKGEEYKLIGTAMSLGDCIDGLFKAREINPTMNNRESSRSHVIVILECILEGGGKLYIWVMDLAGVENEFDEGNLSQLARQMSKALSNPLFTTEDIGTPEENEKAKYVMTALDDNKNPIAKKPPGGQVSGAEPSSGAGGGESKKSDEPVCLPEGVNNPYIGSDIEGIKTELTNEVIRSFVINFAECFPTTKKEKVGDTYFPRKGEPGSKILPWILKVYEKTEKDIRTLVKSLVSKGVNYNKDVELTLNTNIKDFMDTKKIWLKSYKGYGTNEANERFADQALSYSNLYPGASFWTEERIAKKPPTFISYYLASFYPYGGVVYPTQNKNAQIIWSVLKEDWENFAISITDATTMEKLKTGEGVPLWKEGSIDIVSEAIKKIFKNIQLVNCSTEISDSHKDALIMGKEEGYTINSTLMGMTKNLKKIVKNVTVSRFEGDLPLLYGDTVVDYDKKSYERINSTPLEDWIISSPTGDKSVYDDNYGSILECLYYLKTRMSVVDEPPSDPLPQENREDFWKNIDIYLLCQANVTGPMGFGEEPKREKGEESDVIYINDPPSPPFICTIALQTALDKYQIILNNWEFFSENTVVESINDYRNKLITNYTKELLTEYFNLVVKMMQYDIYEGLAKKEYLDIDDEFIKRFVEHKYDVNLERMIEKVKKLIDLIEKNNNATLIGTINTTTYGISKVSRSNFEVKKSFHKHLLNKSHKELKNSSIIEKTLLMATEPKLDEEYLLGEYKRHNFDMGFPRLFLTSKERYINKIVKTIYLIHPIFKKYIDIKKLLSWVNYFKSGEIGDLEYLKKTEFFPTIDRVRTENPSKRATRGWVAEVGYNRQQGLGFAATPAKKSSFYRGYVYTGKGYFENVVSKAENMDEFLELIKNSIKNVPQPTLYLNDVITAYLFKLNNEALGRNQNSLTGTPTYEREIINENLFNLLQQTKSESFVRKTIMGKESIGYFFWSNAKRWNSINYGANSIKIRECREELTGAKGFPRKNLIHSYLFKDVFFINFVNENLAEQPNLDTLLKAVDTRIKEQYNDGEDTYGLSFLKYRAKLYEKLELKKAPRLSNNFGRSGKVVFSPDFFSVMPLREKDIGKNIKYYPKGISIKEEIKLYNELLVSNLVTSTERDKHDGVLENTYKNMYIGDYPYERPPTRAAAVEFYKKRLQYLSPDGPWFQDDGTPTVLGKKYGLSSQVNLKDIFEDYQTKINKINPKNTVKFGEQIIKPIFEAFLKENFLMENWQDANGNEFNPETHKMRYNKATNRPIFIAYKSGREEVEEIFAGPLWFDKIMSYADIEKENHHILDSVIDGDEISEWQNSVMIYRDYTDYLDGKIPTGESGGGGESKGGGGGKKKKRKKKTRRKGKKKSKKKKRKTRKTRKRK